MMFASPLLLRLCPMNLEGAPPPSCEGGLFRWNGVGSPLSAFWQTLGASPLVWMDGSWVSPLRNSKLKTENSLLLPEAK
jgi:hypothetical protein